METCLLINMAPYSRSLESISVLFTYVGNNDFGNCDHPLTWYETKGCGTTAVQT